MGTRSNWADGLEGSKASHVTVVGTQYAASELNVLQLSQGGREETVGEELLGPSHPWVRSIPPWVCSITSPTSPGYAPVTPLDRGYAPSHPVTLPGMPQGRSSTGALEHLRATGLPIYCFCSFPTLVLWWKTGRARCIENPNNKCTTSHSNAYYVRSLLKVPLGEKKRKKKSTLGMFRECREVSFPDYYILFLKS